jgi:hypothetical protein
LGSAISLPQHFGVKPLAPPSPALIPAPHSSPFLLTCLPDLSASTHSACSCTTD